jgi:dTDP-glucose pyrophosphorylase
MLERRYKVGYEVSSEWWFNVGRSDDIAAASAKILDEGL